jgi:diamine N-acetyltransferase
VREAELPDEPILVPRRFAVVDMLAVRKDRQSMGIGHALMEAAHHWTQKRGIDRIELNVWEFNERAISFYQTLGYATSSRLMSCSL